MQGESTGTRPEARLKLAQTTSRALTFFFLSSTWFKFHHVTWAGGLSVKKATL